MKVSVPKQEFEVTPEDLNATQEFLASIVPRFVKEFGGLLQDSVKGWRARNMIQIVSKTKKIIEESGLTQKELEGKFFVQAIEKASVEDDESIQQKWANLLANASTGKVTNDVKYISILSDLNSNEVTVLSALTGGHIEHKTVFGTKNNENLFDSSEAVFSVEKIAEHFKMKPSEVRIMVDNFYRLNICQPPAMGGIVVGKDRALLRTNSNFTLTDLGRAFLDAVK